MMSRRVLSHVVLASLLLTGAIGLGAAFATAAGLTAVDATALMPSEMPSLLGPINEKGRTGWECRPERAAAATGPAAAQLPDPSAH